ncbi:Por secretion system C-terminal sorting domain-containing protein [Chryseobacterium soldanellicola]|uniref:Por secretion system C-terminal sorting domain-containing protein n=1 Tax=Chryseobacterium soldanellicola TaxID=311333 RepID=A0A1H0ZQ72_9FLAO|nr:T9SS type A sorting domain-containing protein [Chryseobacterium soldanellicola]SDQ29655.1 Por secretion system C-terminal sorting domain-containing protein [Chryseobacterium soldanellicola]
MRKSLFAIGLLAISYSVQAQILCHVDTNANMYVSKGTLVYSGGGMQMKGDGIIENHGNVMVSGTGTDLFKTIDAANVDKTEANGGSNFVNKLNEPTAFNTANTNNPAATPTYTYGQLFISGIPQTGITGIVDQEYRQVSHGTYQQIGLPFYDKTASTLSAELGKTFSNVRYSQNEILTYDNATVVSKNVPLTTKLGVANPATAYYMVGGSGLNVSTSTRTLKGRPVSDIGLAVTLQNAGNSVNFGTNGNATNMYNEKYNTYVSDPFHMSTGGTAWQTSFGKNMYELSNPFLTNLDLSKIAYAEPAANGDGVNISRIQGARLEISANAVQTTSGGTGTTSSSFKFVTFTAGVPTGDVDYLMVRPMGTFLIKLLDNTSADQLNFANLRRFNYYTRDANTDYNVAANKNAASGSVKQLGVIALDASGNELGRTYYVVYPNGATGHSADAKTQTTAFNTSVVGTYEEAPTGGYDMNYINSYWLYINEANENNFKGKNIKLKNYSNNIASYKFEVRENAALIANGVHQLSSGTGFYYKAPNGTALEAKQGDVIPVTGSEYDLYYGEPDRVLAVATPSVSISRTVVVYNPDITNYIVRFDPNWKKADIEVYDMSGKLVVSKKSVNTSTDFVIELDNKIKNSYVVKIVSDKGETVNTKILK